MIFPDIHHITVLDGDNRFYVTINTPAYNGGSVHITSTVEDGIFNAGDIMVHLPLGSFVARDQRMKFIV